MVPQYGCERRVTPSEFRIDERTQRLGVFPSLQERAICKSVLAYLYQGLMYFHRGYVLARVC